MAEITPEVAQKLLNKTESEGILSRISSNINRITSRIRRSISNVFNWTKEKTKSAMETIFPDEDKEFWNDPLSYAPLVAAMTAGD